MSEQSPLPEELKQRKPATPQTRKANNAVYGQLPFEDRKSFENAEKGFIASLKKITISRAKDNKITFDLSGLDFLSEETAPDTVNPSLWRQARLNARHHGLFEVVDGIYQVRSFDLANMTLISGDTGWVIIDPLTSAESSKAALDLANHHLGSRPVTGVIYTHSHADHFAGATGVVSLTDALSGKVPVVAPAHFVKEALSENVMAGNVMQRRAMYMYGHLLPHDPAGFVSEGLGANLSLGTTGFVPPNDTVYETGEKRVMDGVEIIFQMVPDTEAVSEFIFYFPQYKALCTSEITSHHLHNVYTPRGAQIRDTLAWADGINEAIDRFGGELNVQFATHHWPTWGRAAAVEYLEKQRDLYKYIHDQTLRLANHGYTKEEIAEEIRLPNSLYTDFSCRDYYGTISHNSKAVYVKYLGYFDGNPAHLNPLPRADAAKHYVSYMGGADAILEKAKESYDKGEYRWVAEVLNHLVMAKPDHIAARALLADCCEQLGYQAESGPWRNFYLTGALELRNGIPEARDSKVAPGMAAGMPLSNVFQAMAVRLNGPKADGVQMAFNLNFTDTGQKYLMTVKNAVLHAFADRQGAGADAMLELSSPDFKAMMMGAVTVADLMAEEKLKIEGDGEKLATFSALFDRFERWFPIVTPRTK